MTAMAAMVLTERGHPLQPMALPIPAPGASQALVRVDACGVCRTDHHVDDGDLTEG